MKIEEERLKQQRLAQERLKLKIQQVSYLLIDLL